MYLVHGAHIELFRPHRGTFHVNYIEGAAVLKRGPLDRTAWCIREEKRRGHKRREGTIRVNAPGDKKRQVANGLGVYEERRGHKRREGVIREEK